MDSGLTFLLTDIVQLDLYIGRGLVGQTEDVICRHGSQFPLATVTTDEPRNVFPALHSHVVPHQCRAA